MTRLWKKGYTQIATTTICVLLCVCTPVDETQLHNPIVGGELDTLPSHMAVAAVLDSGVLNCTGTLFVPGVVVTVAHCVQRMRTNSSGVFFGFDIQDTGQHLGVSDILIHPTWDGVAQGDLALLLLQSVPQDIDVLPILPKALALTQQDLGMSFVNVGFGLTEEAERGLKMKVGNQLAVVCEGPAQCDLEGDIVEPYSFGYKQTQGGTCLGDSGGPAIVTRAQTEYVAGATVYGDNNCTRYGVALDLTRYLNWIGDALSYAGEEICNNSQDDDGDNRIDCADLSCLHDDACDENCNNSVDDNADGRTDCDDIRCTWHPACMPADACQSASLLSCEQEIVAYTSYQKIRLSAYSCDQKHYNGGEAAFRLHAPSGAQVSLTLESNDETQRMFVLPVVDQGCDPLQCILSSAQTGQASFEMPDSGAYVVVDGQGASQTQDSQFRLRMSCEGGEDCSNLIDDDQDGQTDCLDLKCKFGPICQPVEICYNQIDDDFDGSTDCVDDDCAGIARVCMLDEICNNLLDEDFDGKIDCADDECIEDIYCQSELNCDNQFDDDRDSLVDCADPDCQSAWHCQPESNCENHVDDDGDGLTDCDDLDCAQYRPCQPEQDCDNQIDEDHDGATDCQDPDCQDSESCMLELSCGNGVDDDRDGKIDCADPDCKNHTQCSSGCSCESSTASQGGLYLFLLFAWLCMRRWRFAKQPN